MQLSDKQYLPGNASAMSAQPEIHLVRIFILKY
jgi:hypothetical protein